MSPINGIVTGIYKNAGDWVQAGEPIIRVEDDATLILTGTLSYSGSIFAWLNIDDHHDALRFAGYTARGQRDSRSWPSR